MPIVSSRSIRCRTASGRLRGDTFRRSENTGGSFPGLAPVCRPIVAAIRAAGRRRHRVIGIWDVASHFWVGMSPRAVRSIVAYGVELLVELCDRLGMESDRFFALGP